MPTVRREGMLVVKVYGPPREHPPPHVQVEVGRAGVVVIRLAIPDHPLRVWRVYGAVDEATVLAAVRLVETNESAFMASESFESVTDEQILAQIPEARARALRAQTREPHAATAGYDPATCRLCIGLTNGAEFSVAVALVPELRQATDAELRTVEVGPAGVGVHWPMLDIDLSVTGLARLVFGVRVVHRAAGAAAGRVRSPVKAEAARKNGARGGRPRKVPVTPPTPPGPESPARSGQTTG